MKAMVYRTYGSPDVLRLEDVAVPEPQPDQVRIKVRATGLNAADWHLLRADPFIARFSTGLFRPMRNILGADAAGVVEAVGGAVTQFKPGDAVFGGVAGGLAEFACGRERTLAPMPANLTFEQAAAVPMAALTALQGLRDQGKIAAGQRVLIHGAGGGVGTFAVQLAKAFGAEVTAVCGTANVAQSRSLGADHVIDYTREDFSQTVQRYDLILAANGDRRLADYARALTPTGTYVMVGGTNRQMLQSVVVGGLWTRKGGRTFRLFVSSYKQADLIVLKELIEAGRLRPVMDRAYPLREAADALRYVEAGHARGKVIVTP